MTNIDETMNKIDSLLAERGLTSEYKEQAVHQLFCQMIESDLKERKKRSEKIEKEILSRYGCERGFSEGVSELYRPV